MSTPITRRQAITTLVSGTALASLPSCAHFPTPAATNARTPPPPRYVYLTWQSDPCTTMTVNFQSLDPRELTGRVRFWPDKSTHPRAAPAPADAIEVGTASHQIPNLPDRRWVHHVELKDLQPGASYSLQTSVAGSEWTGAYRFRTLPDDDTPLRFVVGGDIGPRTAHQARPGERDPLHAQAALKDPHFALFGGDLAYDDGKIEKIADWDSLLAAWQTHFLAPGRRLIPMILGIGNHEVRGGYNGTPETAPFYYGFFAQAGDRAYFVRHLGPRFALVVLDSGHTATHASQTAWLDEQLIALRDTPHVMVMYHVPLYPGVRPFDGEHSVQGRKEWLPLFDRHKVEVAFENHDHVFKRSHPLRAGKIAAPGEGTIYLGDGALGIGARAQPGDAASRSYLARTASMQHFWLVEEKGSELTYRAFDSAGRIIDAFPGNNPEANANFDRLVDEANAFAQAEAEEKTRVREAGMKW